MTWDGQHPNEQGESLMAERWFAPLRALLDQRFPVAR
jgi:lysophospholipase L1-like esterase